MSLSRIASYGRLKPLEVDKSGGRDSGKRVTAFDETAGVVEMSDKRFDHFNGVLRPDANQEHVYQTIAQPLVRQWIDGHDVDIISYGQTGSGKTFTMFGPPFSMKKAAESLERGDGGRISCDGILREEHGIILRAGFEALAACQALNARGCRAVLHGSMVEMTIMSLTNQSVSDLLNGMKVCFVDKQHHLQGALMMPIASSADLVHIAAAVETRLTRGTKMNDTSSRSHCVTTFTLSLLENDMLRQSRLQFFDLMGSERFKGANAAHNERASSKSSAGGWEGIYANLSLSSLMSAVDLAAQERRRGGKAKKQANAMLNFCLTDLLQGSLMGSALTAMITCLSQAPRNGDETYLSLKYGAGMAKLLNNPAPQRQKPYKKVLENARKQLAKVQAVVARGVNGKYQALREAEVTQWDQLCKMLELLQTGTA